jgi:hypothetical protein
MYFKAETVRAVNKPKQSIPLNVILLSVIMLNVIILNVILLNVILMNVILLNVILQSVIMLNVTAPTEYGQYFILPFGHVFVLSNFLGPKEKIFEKSGNTAMINSFGNHCK